MTRWRTALVRGWAELSEGVRISLSTLAANRLRSFLTTLGVVIGVTTVIAIIAIIQGLTQSFEAQIANLGTNTLYVQRWKWMMLDSEWYLLRNRKPFTLTHFKAVERGSSLATAASPLVYTRAVISHGAIEMAGVSVWGVGPQYLEAVGGALRAGRFFVESEFDRQVTVLGAEVADVLFPRQEAQEVVGQRVLVAGRPFTVAGVLERKGRLLDVDLDKRLVIPMGSFGLLFGNKRSIAIAVSGPPNRLVELEDELTNVVRRARAIPPGQPDDFAINRQDQLLKLYGQITGALYGVAVGVGLVTLIVGGFGIMNIMMVSVRERTREIGVRRALGARKRTILAQFVLEAIVVAALGGAVGTALGLVVAQLIALLTPLPAVATPSAVALGLGFSATVGILFGGWPAWRAANLDPVEALRYE